MDNWHNIYITDKTGKKFFNTNASPMSTMSEIRNLTRHLEAIKAGGAAYAKAVGATGKAKFIGMDGPEEDSFACYQLDFTL